MDWNQRIENYARETRFPVSMAIGGDGRVFGIFIMGADYKVASGFTGGYPTGYLKRIKALFPEKKHVLHLFSGKVDLAIMPGHTVDLDPDLNPTWLDDAQTLENVPLDDYDLILADPPYSVEDAEHYKPSMVSRKRVMDALTRCVPGTHLVILDQVLWMYRKDTWNLEGCIGVQKSTNHRFRMITIFQRVW
jgi:hypothetical protein